MDTMYLASDGRYYGERDRELNFESGWWRLCMRDTETGVEVVVDQYDVMLRLEPICGGPAARAGGRTYEYTLG